MECTKIPPPFLSVDEFDNKRNAFLTLAKNVLSEFGYPKRANIIVESIETEMKGKHTIAGLHYEYTITFAVRKKYRVMEGHTESGKPNMVVKFRKELRKRQFRSLKQLMG